MPRDMFGSDSEGLAGQGRYLDARLAFILGFDEVAECCAVE